jgi:N-acetylneuraminic acid mutarotase
MRSIWILGLVAGLTSAQAAEQAAVPPLPRAVSSFGAVVESGYIYVYGGHSGKTHSYSKDTTQGDFHRLNLAEPGKGWESLPASTNVQGLALVSHAGKIIRIGGMQPLNAPGEDAKTSSVAEVKVYDPAKKTWTDLPALPVGRSSHDAVVIGDTLIVVGGWTMKAGEKPTWHTTSLTLNLKDPQSAWKTVEQPFSRRALTVAAYQGKVYAIAGLDSEGEISHDVNIFDPATGKWTTGPKIPGGRMNGFTPAAVVNAGKLYVSPADGKIYELTGDTWTERATLKASRFVHRVVPHGQADLLVLGGASRGGNVGDCEIVSGKALQGMIK